MRVVAGRFRGRALISPEDQSIRPTSDRVRQAIFNIIEHSTDAPSLTDARIIDLFAGTGALGIEALSRGGRYGLFVEEAPAARALIRQNIENLGLTGETRIYRRDATDLGPAGNVPQSQFAFLDPPYGKGLGDAALTSLGDGGWLSGGAMVVLEERAGSEINLPTGFCQRDMRRWGDTDVHFLRYTATA